MRIKVLLTKEAQQHKTLEQLILFLKESGLKTDAIYVTKNCEFFCSCHGDNDALPAKMQLSYNGLNGLFLEDLHSLYSLHSGDKLDESSSQVLDAPDLKKEFSLAKEKHSQMLDTLYKFWQREVLFYLPEILDTSFGETFSCPVLRIDVNGVNISCSKDFFNSDNLADDVFKFWPVVAGTGKYVNTTQIIPMVSKILDIKIKNFNSGTQKINSEIFGGI